MHRAPGGLETLDLAVSHSATAALVFHLLQHKGSAPGEPQISAGLFWSFRSQGGNGIITEDREKKNHGVTLRQTLRIQYEICECFGCFNEIHISVVCVEGGTSTPHWTLAFLFFYVHWTKRMVSRFCKTLFTRYCRRFFRSLQIWGNYGEIHMGSFPVSDPSRKQVQCPKYQFSGFVP